jgi:serine/arginine repetitive matrix protein 2
VPPSLPAQTAAAHAFLASRPSNATLSASAAAAALRTMSPTPTPVSDVQTKRMLQRQNSAASRGGDGRELQRKISSGSMTERTFRTPSPNRPGQSVGLDDAPPVPLVPRTYNNDHAQRRASSMEPSMRVVAPPPTKQGGRVASLDRAPVFAPKKPHSQRRSSSPDATELERSESRGSINFSYPTGARPNSPPPRPQSRVGSGVSPQAAEDPQNTSNQTTDQPTRKKKRKPTSGSSEGSHLARGAVASKPSGLAVTSSEGTAKQTSSNLHEKRNSDSANTPQPDTEGDTSAYGSDSDSTPEKSKGKRAARASGFLNKQPSVVREDWEGEQENSSSQRRKVENRAHTDLSPISGPSIVRSKKETNTPTTSQDITDRPDHLVREGRPTPQLITTITPTRPKSQTEPPSHGYLEVSQDSSRPARQKSISPSRSTRFSTHLASEFSGRPPHEPPPRSVSPAKSALKHHSPSPQSSSPIDGAALAGWKRTSQASSETSDNVSMASADGLGPRSQRKKSARVSFEAEPEIVGTAAEITPSSTPIFASPQHKDSGKKGWLSKSKGGHLDSIPAEDDMEEVMKPCPVLPSFGSVRGRRDGSAEREVSTVEMVSPSSSESSTASNLATLDTSISSDHAIGGILARESLKNDHEARKRLFRSGDAATTVKRVDHPHQDPKRSTNGNIQPSTGQQSGAVTAPRIPSIAIQPATPGIGESDSRDEWVVEVPGGFPDAFELEGDAPVIQTEGSISTQTRAFTTSSPAKAGISEPAPSELVAAENPSVPVIDSLRESLRRQTDSDSDSEGGSSSIYSDAAEDLSDLEGNGFGSINAIVESPLMGAPISHMTTPPDSPLTGKVGNESLVALSPQESWERAESHWRNVAGRQRNIGQDQQQEHKRAQKKPTRKKTARSTVDTKAAGQSSKGSTPISDLPQRSLPQSSASPAFVEDQGSSGLGTIRRSMREQYEVTSDSPGFRSSMRTKKAPEPESQVRGSLPASNPRGALQKRKIPASPAARSPARESNIKNNATIQRSSVVPLGRRLSNGSDSSSSFKRSRRPASSGNKFTMRTSMRSVDDRPASPPAPAGRGVRSLSPQDRRPFSPMSQGTMRTTMRGSGDAGVPTLRKQEQQRPPSAISGFGKSRSKAKAAPPKPLASKLNSRFADSDDDVSEHRTFRSRFDDSSDDEPGVLRYRPVRGIPGKPDEGDSTDLEDSSDEGERRASRSKRQGPKSPAKSPAVLNGAGSKTARDAEVSSPTERPMSPVDGKKKGIFGRFRSKKAKDSILAPQPANKEQESPHEQGRADLDGARSPELPASPDSRGKLQRRHTPQRMTSDSWPLPPSPIVDETQQPTAPDLVNGNLENVNGRPGLGSRQTTSGTARTEGGTPILGRTGKRKRFPMLRKALGLHD